MKKNIIWDNNVSHIPKSLQTWVLHKKSFMQRLIDEGILDARVQVLKENWETAADDEKGLLNLGSEQKAFVREVLILNDRYQLMFARAVIPENLLKGPSKELFHLGNRPLGSILFNHPEISRGPFSFAFLERGMEEYDELNNRLTINNKKIFARRSVFTWQKVSLLLTEVFLPDMEVL